MPAGHRINWNLANEDPSLYVITLRVLNVGIDQNIVNIASSLSPSSNHSSSISTPTAIDQRRSPSTADPSIAGTFRRRSDIFTLSRRATMPLNQTIGPWPANQGYTLNVTFPAGQYYLSGTINDPRGTSGQSDAFTVIESNDTSCLATSHAASPNASGSTRLIPSSSQTKSTTATADASAATGNKGLSSGGIAAVVIGVLAGLAITGSLLLCLMRRRRRRAGGPEMSQSWPGSRLKHRHLESRRTSNTLGSWDDTARSPIALDGFGKRAGDEKDKSEEVSPDSLAARSTGFGGFQQRSSSERLNPAAAISDTSRIDTPAARTTEMTDFGPSATASRRYSGSILPRSPGKAVPPVERNLSRGRAASQPRLGALAGGIVRSPSSKRKPVPSLGPELRGQLAQGVTAQGSGSEGKAKEVSPQSYHLVPDPPTNETLER